MTNEELQNVNEMKMTNESLLQQAKDQVAKDHPSGFNSWSEYHDFLTSTEGWVSLELALQNAALLAIQRAREEATPKWIKLEPMPSSVPIPGRAVFVWIPGLSIPTVGYRIHGEMGFHVEGHVTENVTHWMELPKDPI